MAMKTTYWVSGIVVAGLLAFAGCGKSGKAVPQQTSAAMEFTKFRQAFPTPTPEQQQMLAKVSQGIRYRLYPEKRKEKKKRERKIKKENIKKKRSN
jgi:hypothetical protein